MVSMSLTSLRFVLLQVPENFIFQQGQILTVRCLSGEKGIYMGGQPVNSEYQLRIADADRIRAAIKALNSHEI